jgi:hypothetical protein
VSTMTTQRIDRLLRSLVGVADVRVIWRGGALRAVHILRASGTQPHQLIRNIVSGLQAGFGQNLLPTQVHIHEDAHLFEAVEAAADVLVADDRAGPDKVLAAPGNGSGQRGQRVIGPGPDKAAGAARTSNGNGSNGHDANGARHDDGRKGGNGHGTGTPSADVHGVRGARSADGSIAARASAAPADVVAAAAELVARRQADDVNAGLTLERIDVDRRGSTLRCRTVLALGEHRYSAIAEVPDSPYAEAELAARVAVDALRAGGLTTAMLGGVGFITIDRTNYCVATVREPGNPVPRASAAPMIDSMAAAATAAVLTALGSFTDARAQNRARAGH